jgi:uncharacterized protein YcfJ
LGAVIGDRHDNRYARGGRERVETRPVESCATVDHWETVNSGYLVDYKYNGRRYTTETDEHPGRYIPVNVSVRPSGYVTNVKYRRHGKKHYDRKHYKGQRKHRGYRKHY